ncbi:acetate kinase [Massilia sp. Root418]|uniref:acetate/propionate family kinase n=1 Tax=Massilia sp. Root418 TaxID=1736532 RepID=UPI0006F3C421|nr:acetate kinase [Massilia sp. Root418]KQW91811.1 acetate kinase [Massilia sp. Root418]
MRADDAVIVINAGSSSIKFSMYAGQDLQLRARGKIENLYAGQTRFTAQDGAGQPSAEHVWPGEPLAHDAAMRYLVEYAQGHLQGHRVVAIGHRIVHGGTDFSGPVKLDAETVARLEKLVPLAPLHQPHNLAPVRSIAALAPQVLQVGCFDTAFHTRQPALAQAFALPREITERGVRRYGFHGLSYEYIASVLPALDLALAAPAAPAETQGVAVPLLLGGVPSSAGRFASQLAGGRVVAAHLGNGASMCAMRGGRSVASTMGFTAIDGLPMGTRCGSVDPGVVLYLMDELQMGQGDIQRLLYQQSGLLGVSGISSDMRTLEQSGDPRARLAIDLMVYRIGRELGSLAAALGGLDGVVFSGGIGENSAALRSAVCRDAAWLGVRLDEEANMAGAARAPSPGGAFRISAAGSAVPVWVVPANEELMIARHAQSLLGGMA